jgi:hypothetical protein
MSYGAAIMPRPLSGAAKSGRAVKERAIQTLKKELTYDEKTFFVAVKSGQPNWAVMVFEGIEKLPAIQSKVANIRKVGAKKRAGLLPSPAPARNTRGDSICWWRRDRDEDDFNLRRDHAMVVNVPSFCHHCPSAPVLSLLPRAYYLVFFYCFSRFSL